MKISFKANTTISTTVKELSENLSQEEFATLFCHYTHGFDKDGLEELVNLIKRGCMPIKYSYLRFFADYLAKLLAEED